MHEHLTRRAAEHRELRELGIDAKDPNTRVKWRRMLAAIAFEIMSQKDREHDCGVSGDDAILNLQRNVATRLDRSADDDQWRLDWTVLQKVSDFTDRCLTETNDVAGSNFFCFSHRGIMEFYCGVHLATNQDPQWRNVSNSAEGDSLSEVELQPQTRGILEESAFDPSWYWTWRFAIDFSEVQRTKTIRSPEDEAILGQSLAQLFNRSPSEEHLRPTELMHRCWHFFSENKLPNCANVIANFHSEFARLCDEEAPMVGDTTGCFDHSSEIIARKLVENFQRCPPPDWKHPTDSERHPSVFWMGSPMGIGDGNEHPRHLVKVQPFEMQATPVTKEQYWLFDPANAVVYKNLYSKYASEAQCPAIGVSWFDSMMFARWLGPEYSLPSEAQWEFACHGGRDGEQDRFGVFWMEGEVKHFETLHPGCANFRCNSQRYKKFLQRDDPFVALGEHPNGVGKTIPVFDSVNAESDFHIRGMHGNVWEWCLDWFDDSAYLKRLYQTLNLDDKVDWSTVDQNRRRDFLRAVADLIPSTICEAAIDSPVGSTRVLRGGSWNREAVFCRSAYRFSEYPDLRVSFIGFRLCRELESNSIELSSQIDSESL
ncbi:MAG: formylglycine-generating enzyme family protein [Planctomycetaceae bacterium]|nr:formylglycine-generating enzyme family protein [Planctomycetaceae bacterium]